MPSAQIHRVAGVLTGIIGGSALLHSGGGEIAALLFFSGATAGASAPDWLEMKWWINGVRHSIIPHRTVTHWVLLWVFVLAFLFANSEVSDLTFIWALRGFCVSCIVHVLMDSTSPMGVPWLSPFRKNTF